MGEENVQSSCSMQFSLTQGSIDLVEEDTEESQPIVRNAANVMPPVVVEGLASPDSVCNEPSMIMK